MTPTDLTSIATAMFGPRWQRELERALGVDDRLVRRWAAGDVPIPDARTAQIRSLARDRAKATQQSLR